MWFFFYFLYISVRRGLRYKKFIGNGCFNVTFVVTKKNLNYYHWSGKILSNRKITTKKKSTEEASVVPKCPKCAVNLAMSMLQDFITANLIAALDSQRLHFILHEQADRLKWPTDQMLMKDIICDLCDLSSPPHTHAHTQLCRALCPKACRAMADSWSHWSCLVQRV